MKLKKVCFSFRKNFCSHYFLIKFVTFIHSFLFQGFASSKNLFQVTFEEKIVCKNGKK